MPAEASDGVMQRRLVTLASSAILFHTMVTILEERLFRFDSFKRDAGGAFMTFCMYTFTCFVYAPIVQRSGAKQLRPTPILGLVASLYVGTTTLTKTSLRYIDMPTQTVIKSAKLLPVMLGSVVLLQKRYRTRDWVAALMLCAGVGAFNASTSWPSLRQTELGVACIVTALLCDALLGNVQKKVLLSGIHPPQLMLYQSMAGAAYTLVICFGNGSLYTGFAMLRREPLVLAVLLLWIVSIICGTALVLQLVSEFSAVTAVIVTTSRKALTLLASFVLFPKPLGIGHPIGAALVFGSAFITLKAPAPGPKKGEGKGHELEDMHHAAENGKLPPV